MESLCDEIEEKTWAYLKRFEKPLRERSVFKRYFTRKNKKTGKVIETGPFYSMFNVGDYTFAPWKVVWREQSAWFTVAVIGPQDGEVVVPDHKLMLVGCYGEQEAHYLAAMLSSSPVLLAVWAYAISIQQTTHILNNINVPDFDTDHTTHIRLAFLSQRAHELAPQAYAGDKTAQAELRQAEEEVDRAAAALWGLSEQELADVKASLQELKG
jgi:hypothetical protein